jgi:Zn-dependent protease with chaperone function
LSATNQGTFKAGLFRPESNEVVEGRMVIGRWSLQFYSENLKEQIMLENIEIDTEDESGRITFTDRTRPELKIFTDDRSLLKHPTFLHCNPLRNQVRAKSIRVDSSRAWRLTGYFVGGALLIYWISTLSLSLAVRTLVNRVPVEWEQKFGRQQIEELRRDHSLVNDPERVAQLTALAEPLMSAVPELKTRPKFYIVKSDDPNAFAMPGGYVVVNTALIQMVDRPEELLGVLAHEIAHVTQRHIERHMISSAGPLMIMGGLLQGRNGVGGLLGAGSAIMIIQGFSQEYETDADDKGWQYLVAAHINPHGMITMFRKVQVWEAAETGKDDDAVPQAFQSHPALEKRITRLESKERRLKHKSDFLTLDPEVWQGFKAKRAYEKE